MSGGTRDEAPDDNRADTRRTMGRSGDRPVVLVSNRGPVTFTAGDDGALRPRRGAGGLVSGLAPLVTGTDTLWIASAMSEGDRLAARHGVLDAEGFRVRPVAVDPGTYRLAYDELANTVLWFVHHGLFDLPHSPSFSGELDDAWAAYLELNRAFADAVVADAPQGAVVLVQDYHLTQIATFARPRRPDLAFVHFSHTPFASPEGCRVLPERIRTPLLNGLADHDACGFHTTRWAEAFTASCRDLADGTPRTFVAPLGPDPADLAATAAGAACRAALAQLDRSLGDRRFIVRVDRIELSKNVVRGFEAFDLLLERHPEWRFQVVFGASVYPSREGVPAYRAYRELVESTVARVNERWATADWTPIVYDPVDDYPRSVAALCRYDVLLVNPIRDGLNLVAKEGPLVNERDGVLCCSTEAGAWAELAGAALAVEPFDVAGTAEQLHTALAMPAADRRRHAAAVAARAGARSPGDWLADNLAAATR